RFAAATLIAVASPVAAQPSSSDMVSAALDDMHAAAARSDGAAYGDRLDVGLVWIGNDITERWTRPQFLAFAEPIFAAGDGWTYASRARRVWTAPDPCGCLAWVDEVLDSE